MQKGFRLWYAFLSHLEFSKIIFTTSIWVKIYQSENLYQKNPLLFIKSSVFSEDLKQYLNAQGSYSA